MFFRRKVIDNIGLFDETFIRHQDLEYLVRFFNKYKIINLNEYLVIKDETDRGNVVNVEKSIECRKHFLNKFSKEIDELSVDNDIMYLNYVSLAMLSLYNKNYKCFKEMKKESESFRKTSIKIHFKYLLGFIIGYVNLLKVRNVISKIKLRKSMPTEVSKEINKYI